MEAVRAGLVYPPSKGKASRSERVRRVALFRAAFGRSAIAGKIPTDGNAALPPGGTAPMLACATAGWFPTCQLRLLERVAARVVLLIGGAAAPQDHGGALEAVHCAFAPLADMLGEASASRACCWPMQMGRSMRPCLGWGGWPGSTGAMCSGAPGRRLHQDNAGTVRVELDAGCAVLIPHVTPMSNDVAERQVLMEQGTWSLVTMPMTGNGARRDFVRFGAVATPRRILPGRDHLIRSGAAALGRKNADPMLVSGRAPMGKARAPDAGAGRRAGPGAEAGTGRAVRHPAYRRDPRPLRAGATLVDLAVLPNPRSFSLHADGRVAVAGHIIGRRGLSFRTARQRRPVVRIRGGANRRGRPEHAGPRPCAARPRMPPMPT